MEIGEQVETVIVEPLDVPEVAPKETPIPERERELVPA